MNRKAYTTLLLAAMIFSCKNGVKNNPKTISPPLDIVTLTNAQYKNAGIETTLLMKHVMETSHKSFGKVFYSPQHVISINAPYGGIVKSIRVAQGDFVSQGQVLGTLEDPQLIQLQQDYLLTKSKLKLSKLDYERQKDLNASKASSDRIFQLSENEMNANQILMKALSEKLKLIGIHPEKLSEGNLSRSISILASASGYVTRINVNLGKYVLPSESLFEIINNAHPLLKLKMFERDLPKIYKGMRLKAYNYIDPNENYNCEVISYTISLSEDGSADVICRFLSPSSKLYQNLSMVADIEIASSNQWSIPESAIVRYEGKNYVFIEVSDKKYKMEEVQVGTVSKGMLEIGNINQYQNKKIVKTGAYSLLMALKNTD